MGAAWSISGMIAIGSELGERWPACADDLTPEIRAGLERTEGLYSADARARIERRRTELNEAMARIFDVANGGVDLVITASNPDIAFAADGPLPSTFGGVEAGRRRTTACSRSPPTCTATRRSRSRPASSTGCRSDSRSSAATSPSRCCSTSPSASSASGRGHSPHAGVVPSDATE